MHLIPKGFSRSQRFLLGRVVAVAALTCVAAPASAAIIDVAGFTKGCFGTGCTTFIDPALSSSDFGLTFTGTSFDVDTSSAGVATNINLGAITRTNEQIKNSESTEFTLQVTFTLPLGITDGSPESFTATITGQTPGGGGPVPLLFDNEDWILVSYENGAGSGSFEFSVINDPLVNPNGTATILGGIRNATFTPTQEEEDPPPTSNLPEPSMLVLLGAAAAAFARHRQSTKQ